MKERTLVIGDIHGGLRPLKQVLQRAGYDPKEDQLIFLGDYVDGWSESSEVIQFLIELEEEAEIKPIFIRGNHDKWCEDWLTYGTKSKVWVEHGGKATIESYIRTGYLADPKHREFFQKLKNFYICGRNYVYVHGGFRSLSGVGKEEEPSTYYWDRELWSIALEGERVRNRDKKEPKPWKSKLPIRLRPHKKIFIGHTSTTNWGEVQPMVACNVTNVDTGCGWNGKLSCYVVETKEFFQSDFAPEMYPKELGRI